MRKSTHTLLSLAAVALMSLVLAACSSSPKADEAGAASVGAAKENSGGLLGKLMESSKPVTVTEGTALTVALDQSLTSNQQKSGDEFEASAAAPVVVAGKTVIPKGARFKGRVVEARGSGRLQTVARLRLALSSVEVDGKTYDIQTNTLTRSGGDHKKRNLALIGGGAGLGTVIGAVAGGGKGALIGGAVGAGAGTATAAATGKKDITVPAETTLTFKLTEPVTIQVKG